MPRLIAAVFIAALVISSGAAVAQDERGSIDVVVVGGPMDHRTVEFVAGAIAETNADLVVLQLDVEAVLGGDVGGLIDAITDSPVPVTAWVGPAPATVQGAAVDLFAAAGVRGAAPGVTIGRARPSLAGGAPDGEAGDWPDEYAAELLEIT
ncbi:MAG TPA: hypothetical protein VFY15_02380, partial [Acidimicrobiia bacterium]|nr:hypothetical protein [Acidimicrobiia bacterium]